MTITLLNAGPGSGKSFTINHGFRLITNNMIGRIDPTDEQKEIFDYLKTEFPNPNLSCCFFAHNNSTKDHLINHLPRKTPVFTFHGAGMSTITKRYRFQRLDSMRTEKLISDMTGRLIRDMNPTDKFHWLGIKKLVNYLKLENLEPSDDSLHYIKTKYPDMAIYHFPPDWLDKTTRLLDRCAIINGSIEFVDMLWLGAKAAVRPQYDLGFIDESQDISKIAYVLVTRLCKNVVFCGDKNQAINAFAGASEEMYDDIANKADAILPLKMTLRCPEYIVDMANYIRPKGIIKGPNNMQGQHETIDYDSLPGKLVTECKPNNTLIISRTNAAVISCAIMLTKAQVPCRIVDKDLADEVKYFFKSFHTQSLPKLYDAIDKYEEKHSRAKNPLWVQMCKDKADYAKALLDSVSNWSELMDLITETFETHLDGYKLSSIHKAKGLEARNIFILNPPVELAIAMNHPIAREQELNLHFVALTRCELNLYWVK